MNENINNIDKMLVGSVGKSNYKGNKHIINYLNITIINTIEGATATEEYYINKKRIFEVKHNLEKVYVYKKEYLKSIYNYLKYNYEKYDFILI